MSPYFTVLAWPNGPDAEPVEVVVRAADEQEALTLGRAALPDSEEYVVQEEGA